MKVAITLDVPEVMQPAVSGIGSVTGLSHDQVVQRVFDSVIPRVLSGHLEYEKLVTTSTLLETFPEIRDVFKWLGFSEESSLDEILMAAASAMMFLSMADRIVETCPDEEDGGRLH